FLHPGPRARLDQAARPSLWSTGVSDPTGVVSSVNRRSAGAPESDPTRRADAPSAVGSASADGQPHRHSGDDRSGPPADAAFGQPVAPWYRVVREVGRGPRSVVYEARQLILKRVVALKVIRAGERTDPGELDRLRATAEAVARLRHPNLLSPFEVDD